MSTKAVKYLSSLRFTLLVISLLGIMFLLGIWIPQERIVSQEVLEQWQRSSPTLVAALKGLGFLSINTSPVMLVLWLFFFVNLSLVMWQRIPLVKKRIAVSAERIADPERAPGYSFRASYPLPQGGGAPLFAFLRKERYTVVGDAAGFVAVKNRLSPVAFMLFHLSFFLILLGAVTSCYTKFLAVLEVAEGETFQGEVERYEPTPEFARIGRPPRVSFTVKSVTPKNEKGMHTGLEIRLIDAGGAERVADVNRPYKADNTSFVVDNVGVAPLFVVKDPSGKEVDGAFMRLHVMGGKEDGFALAGYQFRTRFYPNYVLKGGKPASASDEFKNPVFSVSVLQKGGAVAQGNLSPGGALPFAGYQLVLKQMPLWVRFSVIKEYGLSLIYAGFAVASLAVVWRFLFYRRELVGRVREEDGECRLVVAGRSEFYKSLAEDEFGALFDKFLQKTGSTN